MSRPGSPEAGALGWRREGEGRRAGKSQITRHRLKLDLIVRTTGALEQLCEPILSPGVWPVPAPPQHRSGSTEKWKPWFL